MDINTNVSAMIAASNLNKTQNAIAASTQKLSSGFRINSAADDAASRSTMTAGHADVICDLNLLANNDEGFPESLLHCDLRAWLEQEGIPHEVHQDLVQLRQGYRPDPSHDMIQI